MTDVGADNHVVGISPDFADGLPPGTVWVVTLDGEEYTATYTIHGQDAVEVIGEGRSFTTTHLHMIREAMGFLGLVRHEPGPDDAPDVAETWHIGPDTAAVIAQSMAAWHELVDPEQPTHPFPPTQPQPPDHPPR